MPYPVYLQMEENDQDMSLFVGSPERDLSSGNSQQSSPSQTDQRRSESPDWLVKIHCIFGNFD